MNLEKLTLEIPDLRVTGEAGQFEGMAALFHEPNSFNEVIAPGAFRKTLRERKPAMFFNHDPGQVVGVWNELHEDTKGLKVAGQLVTETRAGSEALALIKAKAVTGLSIGFRARGDKRGPNGQRILTDIELVEISLTSIPAADKARITKVRSLRQAGLEEFTEAVRSVTAQLRG